MSIINIIEIFTLVTGLVFIVMQILQHKYMWYMNIVTAAGALVIALISKFWANAALQAYFIVMAIVGIVKWKRLREGEKDEYIHVVEMPKKILGVSAAITVLGGALLYFILLRTNDPNPVADALTFILSIVAAWWLARSYIEEWLLWMVADGVAIWLYASQSHWGMVALYAGYIISSVIGLIHWKKNGLKKRPR